MFSSMGYRPSSLYSLYHMHDKPAPVVKAVEPVREVKAPVVEPRARKIQAPVIEAPKIEEVEVPVEPPVTKAPRKQKIQAPKVAPIETPKVAPVEAPNESLKVEEPKAPRLRIIHQLLSKEAQVTVEKPKRVTAMSSLWKTAQAQGIKGYNRMKKSELEALLNQK